MRPIGDTKALHDAGHMTVQTGNHTGRVTAVFGRRTLGLIDRMAPQTRFNMFVTIGCPGVGTGNVCIVAVRALQCPDAPARTHLDRFHRIDTG